MKPRILTLAFVLALCASASCGDDAAETTVATTAAPATTAAATTTTLAATTSAASTTTTETPVAADCSAAGLSPAPSSQDGLPDEVRAMREQVVAAAASCDFDGLGALGVATANGFWIGNEAVVDPAAWWRDTETSGGEPLRGLTELLELPYGVVGASEGAMYVWPSVFSFPSWSATPEADLEAVRALLGESAFTFMADLDLYLGPRLAIAESGEWLFFHYGEVPWGGSDTVLDSGGETEWLGPTDVAIGDFDAGATYAEKLVDVRTGGHGGFSRIVFEFASDGAPPVHWVGYRADPVYDPAGAEVAVDGAAVLYVSLFPGRVVDFEAPDQPLTYTGPTRFAPNVPEIREVAFVSDFEATMEWVIGTEGAGEFRAFALESPPRIVVDIASPAVAGLCSADGMPATPVEQQDLPDAVATTRNAIVEAATSCDIDELADLALRGDSAFEYSFGPQGDPRSYWAEYEGLGLEPLRLLAGVLDVPYTVMEWTKDDGTVERWYVWPRAMATPWDEISDEEEGALRALVGDEAYEEYGVIFGAYAGPRVGILENGDWGYFIVGGD